ncbi:hypothetical protein PABY_11060 [Pyrodictium abyssi]|uniref:Uncharacterized protein n=1 Tax=Pyrodictium abyssi TaxID=54256 RepID=A0ABM8IZH3_9CREN|nr:hypothetical protein PABY_11060 [Pyrodictium abyssi]
MSAYELLIMFLAPMAVIFGLGPLLRELKAVLGLASAVPVIGFTMKLVVRSVSAINQISAAQSPEEVLYTMENTANGLVNMTADFALERASEAVSTALVAPIMAVLGILGIIGAFVITLMLWYMRR